MDGFKKWSVVGGKRGELESGMLYVVFLCLLGSEIMNYYLNKNNRC